MKTIITSIIVMLFSFPSIAQIPHLESVYRINGMNIENAEYATSSRLEAIKGNNRETDFALIGTTLHENLRFDTLVIDGNVRYHAAFTVNDNGKIYIKSGSDAVLNRPRFESHDTVHVFGSVNINIFTSQDTVVFVKHPSATITNIFTSLNPGDIVHGSCDSGRLIVIESNTPEIDNQGSTTGIIAPDIATGIKWQEFAIYNTEGKMISTGKYDNFNEAEQAIRGIYIVRLWNKNNTKSFKKARY